MTPSMLASMLGRLAAGKPKRYSKAELRRRSERLAAANRKRLAALRQKKQKKART